MSKSRTKLGRALLCSASGNGDGSQRRASAFEVRTMSSKEYLGLPSRCAWHGCGKTTANPDGAGWSKLLLYKGKTHSNFLKIKRRDMYRDCVLCPEHSSYLDERLLVDLGRALIDTAGVA